MSWGTIRAGREAARMEEVEAERARWSTWIALAAVALVGWAVLDAGFGLGAQVAPQEVVFNEIHYNPAEGGVEFIELHNVDDETVDLAGFDVAGLVTLPDGTSLEPGAFLVVTADLPLFEALNPGVVAVQWNEGESLDDAGQNLVLVNAVGETIDEVSYEDGSVDPLARYTIDELIEGSIGAGDGGNPNQADPMGLHDAPLYLPEGWSWTQGPTRNVEWGTFGTGSALLAEWRCGVIPEFGHVPPVPFRINVRNASYWQFADDTWTKGFDVNLLGGHRGSYLGEAGVLNGDPFSNDDNGRIQWRLEDDGSFSAPWSPEALMMHFWASQRLPALPGQTAELSTSEFRLQQPDDETVDLSTVKVLFQCGVDYYNTQGGQGTKVPGPGIGKYHAASETWQPSLWVTLPLDAPAASTGDFRTWLTSNLPPIVQEVDDDDVGWPTEPAGTGWSLELIDPELDNSLARSWAGSGVEGGTPGASPLPRCNGLIVTVDIGAGDVPTDGPDVILGTDGADVINALEGDDTICGMGGEDVISGGGGLDTFLGAAGVASPGGVAETAQ
ncbi:MAG: lamin tail domain-containing protein [Acidimicrobiia bacterium]|nr:lamin tail domain-containing protein [Acidimicrobiia bacterium]